MGPYSHPDAPPSQAQSQAQSKSLLFPGQASSSSPSASAADMKRLLKRGPLFEGKSKLTFKECMMTDY